MIVGVDPGLKGGIVILDPEDRAVSAWRADGPEGYCATGRPDIARLVQMFDDDRLRSAVIEKAGVMPKQGISSALTIGVNYGLLLGALRASRLPVREVAPATWTRGFGWRAADRAARKLRAVALVRLRIPSLDLLDGGRLRVPHTGLADAACLALWALDSRSHAAAR